MASQIVHDDNVARAERGHQELLGPGEEAFPIDGTVDHAGRIDPIVAQGSDEGHRAPPAMRHLGVETLTAETAAMGPGHVGLGPGLVDEDEAGRRPIWT